MKKISIFLIGTCLAANGISQNVARASLAEGRGASAAASAASITQSAKKFPGFFTFYYDEKSGKIYLEVDSTQLGKDILYFSSLSTGVEGGGAERGQSNSELARFIKVGPKILLIEPNMGYRAITENPDEINAVDNAFAPSVVFGAVPVSSEGGKYLLDFTSFVVRDALKVGDRLGAGRGGGRGAAATARPATSSYRLDEGRSVVYMDNTKNFPLNTEFEAMLTFSGGASGGARFGRGSSFAPDPSSVTLRMHQALVALPEVGYKPRKFDPRSGFNMFSYMDFSAPMTEPIEKKFTRRHRLEKKDPKAAMSEPVEPIMYYVDRGAPEPIKKALIEGGSWWNQAFEAAGYKNAFIVKELPEGADPMDIRYNVVNWINRPGGPRAFSSGASYIDPRTGEIIKGVVTLGSDRHRQDFLIAEGLLQPYEDGKPVSKAMEELALARIRQLSAHEIGHTLGLFHNFAASPKGRASVMDYPFPRFDLKADGTIDVSDAYAKGIGSWDKRAITWGYADFPKGTDENAGLDKIMNETLNQGFVFIPDIGGNAHPVSHQWDDGENPIAQLDKLMKVRRQVLDNFSEKAIQKDAPMATLEEVLVPMYLLHRYQVEAAAKSVGGLFFTHAVKNDGQVITKMVEPSEQMRALHSLLETITPEALILPEKLISKIPPRPSGYPASMETFTGHTGPTFDPFAVAESAAGTTLSYLLDPARASRLVEYNARDSKQPGLIAVIDTILANTWKKPLQPGYKGELQVLVNNLTLKQLLMLAADAETSESVRGIALLKVEELKDWMDNSEKSAQPKQRANMLFALSQIKSFEGSPDKFQPQPPVEMPPGAPIGMPEMDLY